MEVTNNVSVGRKRKVIRLLRVSSEGQAKEDRTGIPQQLEDIELHCEKYSLEVATEYRFEGLSGADVQKSKRFKEMLAELSKPSIAGVVFSKLDRFFRPEQLSSYGVFRPFESSGKHLFCELGELDPRDSQDQLRIVLYGQMAGFERERIKNRMVRGKNKNRIRADIKSDTLPVGVEYDKSTRLFSYTPEAERVREAIHRVLKGETLASIAADLGFKQGTSLRATLKSFWWIGVKASVNVRGERKWDEERDKMGEGPKIPRETPIMVDTNLAINPLVSREEFFAVQDILVKNRTAWTQRKSRVNEFLCTGVLYCECGRKMYHKKDKRPGKPSYYLCSSNYNKQVPCGRRMIEASKVDRDVWAQIRLHTKSEKYLSERIAIALGEHSSEDHERAIREVERKLKVLDKEERGLAEAIRYMGFNTVLGDQMKDIELKRAELRKKLDYMNSIAAEKDAIDPQSVAKQIKARFWAKGNLTIMERKSLFADMVDSVMVSTEPGEESAVIRFRVPASYLAMNDSINRTLTDTDSSQRPT